jgi:hypothetical protein
MHRARHGVYTATFHMTIPRRNYTPSFEKTTPSAITDNLQNQPVWKNWL